MWDATDNKRKNSYHLSSSYHIVGIELNIYYLCLNLKTIAWGKYYYFYFADYGEETEA